MLAAIFWQKDEEKQEQCAVGVVRGVILHIITHSLQQGYVRRFCRRCHCKIGSKWVLQLNRFTVLSWSSRMQQTIRHYTDDEVWVILKAAACSWYRILIKRKAAGKSLAAFRISM
jgi:hypothetical protein